MPLDFPLFSVVIPTYNRAHLIGETIKSVLAVTFSNFEILVIDDGGKDNTQEVVSKFTDDRVHYYKKENAERGAARNYGRIRAKGMYVNFFDSDDLMYPNHLAVAKQMIDEVHDPEFFHLGYDFKNPQGEVTKKVNQFDETIRSKILFDNLLSCNGVFVRRDIAALFPFEENRMLASAEDWELWIRLAASYTLHYSNEITTSVVNHDQRSIRTIPSEKLIARDMLLVQILRNNPSIRKMYGKDFKTFIAERYTFIMLCLAEDRKPLEVAKWAGLAMSADPAIALTRRFLMSIKNCLRS